MILHADSEDTDQPGLPRPGGYPGLSESSLGAQVILLVLSCDGSNNIINA